MAAALARRRRRLAARRRERLSTGDWCSLGDWRGVEALQRRRNAILFTAAAMLFFRVRRGARQPGRAQRRARGAADGSGSRQAAGNGACILKARGCPTTRQGDRLGPRRALPVADSRGMTQGIVLGLRERRVSSAAIAPGQIEKLSGSLRKKGAQAAHTLQTPQYAAALCF